MATTLPALVVLSDQCSDGPSSEYSDVPLLSLPTNKADDSSLTDKLFASDRSTIMPLFSTRRQRVARRCVLHTERLLLGLIAFIVLGTHKSVDR